MLPRQSRITRRQFADILKVSRSWAAPFLSLRVARMKPVNDLKSPLFAFVVSRKVAALAVDRNKLKRRARAIIQELLPKIKDNWECLLFFKKGSVDLSFQELRHEIEEVLIRSSVLSQ